MKRLAKRILSLVVVLVLACLTLVPAFATSHSGYSSDFGNWLCITSHLRSNPTLDKIVEATNEHKVISYSYVESVMQYYSTGAAIDRDSITMRNSDWSGVILVAPSRETKTTTWSFHSMQNNGKGMTKNTQLIGY
jgi:predicted PurR-regulated permease PerM